MSVADDIYDRLHPVYRRGDEVLRVIVEVTAPALQSAVDALANQARNFDPDTAPDAWLSWLLERIGWPVDDTWPAYTRRQILKNVGRWRKSYGRPGVIEEIVHTYFTPSASAVGLTVQIRPRGQTDGDLYIGQAYIGQAHVWSRFSRNVLRVVVTDAGSQPYTSDTTARLSSLLETLIPPWMTFTVIPPV